MLTAGSAAPPIELGGFSLHRALKDAPVLVVFFKVSCPTCQFTLPFLERLYRQGRGSRIVGISQDGDGGTSEFLDHFEITFPVFADPKSEGYIASNAYGLTHVPSLFLVDSTGQIAWSIDGFHKLELEKLGQRFGGVSPFREGERVPAMRPG